ncbi:NAD(P)/FAD-dependent oxidoreductase [Pedobacter cryophilus]|uniref:NAD(P)/FAD-dependent oxidoreductase n=1 Tax=Pedobacter cryophilus TaxID=2571271 RepID=A0A4U1C8X2_9SPHI|nr:NAD(P)/FAD-dependent oxidoreductase [Pedobacter cryophilus]TKC00867.1 NAD(P)/FAD-dependent oxidoreductase [Pedobacter cryophilus]
MQSKPTITIIGGGLAGLTNAILLVKSNFVVTVIERKKYPFHRVCGEYVSNEVLPFLKDLGLKPDDLGAAKISKLVVSAPNAKQLKANLDLGAFGISRYVLDHELYKIASALGVKFILEKKVLDIRFSEEKFEIELANETLTTDLVIGAFGKRSNLDQKLNRDFFYQRSPYVGVKYHIKTNFPEDTIQLDNFKGGYCGINKIEKDLYCLCYLAENKYLKELGSITAMEEEILKKNPHLQKFFNDAEFVWDKPETINEISFEKKSLVENHILMCGDTAGMIAPLCGNGMAIAIHSAKLLSENIIQICKDGLNPQKRSQLEKSYQLAWENQFALRLKIGRGIQSLFGSNFLTQMAIAGLKMFPSVTQQIVKKTHGKPF